MRKIGFSHGVIYRFGEKYSPASIKAFKDTGADAIEVCIHDVLEIEKLVDITEAVKKFPYKSIHLPPKILYKDDIQTKEILDKVSKFYSEIEADLALVHPDMVEDWKVFGQYDLNWAVENMDDRKKKYQTIGEFENFFKADPDWKLVLDLNHCYLNDKTMKLADEMIAHFGNRIAEIHLAGFAGSEKLHDPLFETKQDFIIDYCKKTDVPIIIESVLERVEDIKKEFGYISERLK